MNVLAEGMDADSLTDHQLLAAHVAGDPQAFAVLFGRHQNRLWAVALRTMRKPEDAADALQDAMISAFRRASGFRGDSQVTTWLHRIVVNACLDRLRHNKVRQVQSLPDDVDRDLQLADGTDLTAGAERWELRRIVLEALDSINPDQRAAIVLVDMEGYSVEETAAMLGCATGTIKSRCSRGRAKLAPLLQDLRDKDLTNA
ncbi:RNA polymerase ECF family sigma subunit [Luteococcus japonicus]|uniref:RNA polymerase sigma-70 factor, ECF subfamily n=2 Tax=Luteococcus japonicus TaxID=33984 RepID=A0A1R4J8P9_9ACTN|nr:MULTISPECIES: RNA polymerase sigma factor SigM [Luteococcus]MDN5563282.1 RNA polymerase sigma factor SigM [Luteococcus sp.]ROR54856.1 RNA polymerase ECF family sigma subunit [Luteococcus japonicus]SJN28458.1 RNA polymerase sigma-70 factor, ECF subfamily [Luteococcus japonicus LSP_Lj1]